MATAQASAVILLACTHKQGYEDKILCSVVHPPVTHTQYPADDGPEAETAVRG